jgi:hypothetical protein
LFTKGRWYKYYYYNKRYCIIEKIVTGKLMGCGMGIAGGRIGGCGIEGMADRVVRNGMRDGLAVSVAFKSMACPFLYTVKVRLWPIDLY